MEINQACFYRIDLQPPQKIEGTNHQAGDVQGHLVALQLAIQLGIPVENLTENPLETESLPHCNPSDFISIVDASFPLNTPIVA